MAAITSSNLSNDQEKFLASKLIARAQLRMVAASVCEKVKQPEGTGATAYFIRYNRMNVPTATLTEGTTPTESTFTISQFSVTLDQWGDLLILTDVAQLTTKHPAFQQAMDLLADNAQRVIDREVQIVWLANTNVQYGDGSVTARPSITSAMTATNATLHKARITMVNNGVPGHDGPYDLDFKLGMSGKNSIGSGSYLAICGPEVQADILATGTSFGVLASVATYQDKNVLYNGEFGTWLGFRWILTNFIPKFQLLGNTTAAVSSASAFGTDTPVVTAVNGGGTLTSATTYFYKVTRKKLDRGFEEFISIAHSTASAATGDNESFTFNFSGLTAGYVYNLYFDTVQAGGTGTDATLRLVSENIAVGTTVTVTAVPSTGANPPASVPTSPSTLNVYPVWIHGSGSCKWVGLQDLKMFVTKQEASDSDPLAQRRKVGYKFMGKSIVPDSTRLLRLELASAY